MSHKNHRRKQRKQRGKQRKGPTSLEAARGIRKPMPPPTRVIHPKKKYDRSDDSWKDDIDKNDENEED